MKTRRLRFGCHDFLNASPFTFAITEGSIEADFDIDFAPPAKLADSLRDGRLDMAFIPAVEFAAIPGLEIVPGFSIAAMGEVGTVLLVSNGSLWEVNKVAADNRSRTSVALLKILFREFFRKGAGIINSRSLDLEEMMQSADAALVIGDESFGIDREKYRVTDLAEAWFAFTGKPVVFALLCVREGVDAGEAVRTLEKSKRASLENPDGFCSEVAPRFGVSAEICRDYLTKKIRYDLNSDDLDGLKLFFRLAAKNGIIEQKPEIRFYGSSPETGKPATGE
jgi:chorismate dehydratase